MMMDATGACARDADQFIVTRRILRMYLAGGPQQRSAKWFAMRGERITGSVVDLLIQGKTAYSTRDRLLLEKAGMPVEFKGNVATRHGTRYEADAIKLFEDRTGFIVLEMGLVEHPEFPLLAHSPDGIVLRPGLPPALLEVRARNTSFNQPPHALSCAPHPVDAAQVKTPFRRAFEDDTHIHQTYTHQCLMGCSVFNVESVYFVQYRPPGHLGKPELLTIIHEPHDPNWLDTHRDTFTSFWDEVVQLRKDGWETHALAAKLRPKPEPGPMFKDDDDEIAAPIRQAGAIACMLIDDE